MNGLRAGIIGIGGYGARVLKELARNDIFNVCAVADRDRELADSLALEHDAHAYDDFRSLIVQEDLDVVFLTLPTFLCGECISTAAKKGIHVFKESPLARSVPEAVQWVKLMAKAGGSFRVSAQRRFAPGYLEAHRLLEGEPIGQIFLVRADSFLHYEGDFSWRGDPVLAGGGVLQEMAYHMIDQITWNMGPPERIYALHSNRCSKRATAGTQLYSKGDHHTEETHTDNTDALRTRPSPPYRTEDTATLTMKFPNGAVGNVLSSWMSGPEHERLMIHGTEGTMEVGVNLLRITDPSGQVRQEETYEVDDQWLLDQQIRHFADTLIDPELQPVSTAQEHLINVAVIESAYLSARTQMPEPLKVYGAVFDILHLPE